MSRHLLRSIFITLSVCSSVAAAIESKTLAESSIDDLYSHVGGRPSPIHVMALSSQPSVAEQAFTTAFVQLLPTLRKSGLTLSRWFREDHFLYLKDYLSDSQKLQMVPIFAEIGRRVASGQNDMRTILIGAGPAELMARVGGFEREILRLKEQHKDVIRFALAKHEVENQQLYAGEPYSFHLRAVREVLKRFGFGPKDSPFGLKLGTAAWLHDVVEDTDATYSQLRRLYGVEIAKIVRGVTKIEMDGTSEEKLVRTYSRARENKGSRILKLADRIANVEQGLIMLFSGQPTKVQKYFGEWIVFRDLLYVPGDADDMWLHLERLLTDLAYSQRFALERIARLPAACSALSANAQP